MRKGLKSIYIMTAAVFLMQTAAFASPTISDTPYEVSTSDTPTETAETANVSGSMISDAPIGNNTAEEPTGPSAGGSGSGKVIMSIGGKGSTNSS